MQGQPLTRGRVGAAALPLAIATALLAASPSRADVHLSVFPTAPDPLAVGQMGVTAKLRIVNASTGAQATQTVTLNPTITLVPSCSALVASPDCPPNAVDVGVLVPTPGSSGQGEAGTACAGALFAIRLIDPTQGKYLFAPSRVITLNPPTSGATATCIIDFGLDVNRAPSQTVEPGPTPLTAQLAFAEATAKDKTGGGAVGSIELGITATGSPPPPLSAKPAPSSEVTTPDPTGQRTPARLMLSVSPRTARVGQAIRLTGRLLGGPVPPHGKQISLEGGIAGGKPGWVTFKVIRTDARGMFAATYRFRLPGPGHYVFRAVSRVEAGYPYTTGRSNVVAVTEPR